MITGPNHQEPLLLPGMVTSLVDLSTGVPAISDPIYTLSAPGINMPISISYYASGIKVRDVASAVGLGWRLNAGGVISRSVFGQPDEYLEMYSFGEPQTLRPPWKNKEEFMQSYMAAEATQAEKYPSANMSNVSGIDNRKSSDFESKVNRKKYFVIK